MTETLREQYLRYENEHGHLHCDFCGESYHISINGRDDDWLNACEPCAAEGAAQLEQDEARYGKA